MKKIILVLFIAVQVFSFKKTYGQKNGETAAIAAGIIGGAVAAYAAIEQFEERLELDGTKYLLENHPELTHFDLKVLDLEGVKMSDLSNVSCVTFSVNILEPYTTNSKDKMVLMMFLSRGWMNQFGIDYTKVKYKLIGSEEWDSLLFNYVSLASPIKIEDKNKISTFKKSANGLANQNQQYFGIPQGDGFVDIYVADGGFAKISESKLTSSGLERKYFDADEKVFKTSLVLPFLKLSGDTYVTKDYSQEFKMVYNESSMGLYIKSLKDLVQLRRSSINKIQDFFH